MKNIENPKVKVTPEDLKINRKQAIKRAGFYAATAAGMIALLGSPKKSAAGSTEPTPPPVWDQVRIKYLKYYEAFVYDSLIFYL